MLLRCIRIEAKGTNQECVLGELQLRKSRLLQPRPFNVLLH
jgi:hypothetical protein